MDAAGQYWRLHGIKNRNFTTPANMGRGEFLNLLYPFSTDSTRIIFEKREK